MNERRRRFTVPVEFDFMLRDRGDGWGVLGSGGGVVIGWSWV